MNLKTVKLFLSKNSPLILACMGVAGTIMTVYNAHQDTIKAEDIKKQTRPRNLKEEIQDTWKCYIPTAISVTGTIGCIIGSHYCSSKQREALASAYVISQTTLQKYQEKVIERIGKNKSEALREEVMNEVAEYQSPKYGITTNKFLPIDTGHGTTLFYLIPADIWFYSDKNYLDAQTNAMNRDVLTEGYFDGNEIMYRWGLPMNKLYSEWVFTATEMFEPKFSSELMDNGQVRVNIDYQLTPLSEYMKRGR